MDRITFDFENETIRIENNDVRYEQPVPGLAESKGRILMDAGIMTLNMDDIQQIVEDFQKGIIDQEEFARRTFEVIMDTVKSQLHNELN